MGSINVIIVMIKPHILFVKLSFLNEKASRLIVLRPPHVAKLGEITGKTRVLYSELGKITGKTRVLLRGSLYNHRKLSEFPLFCITLSFVLDFYSNLFIDNLLSFLCYTLEKRLNQRQKMPPDGVAS